jgi:hypothetical protein
VLREIELFDTCRNNDAGDPENALTETRDCCHKSEWEKDGFCGDEEFGKQKYTRTITNPEMCGDDGDEFGLETEFMEDCCALTPWEIDTSKVEGGQNYCRPDGTRWEKRELVNRSLCRGDSEYLAYEDRMRRVPCCYKTAWENDNVCGFFENGKQKEIRTIENPDMCDLDPMDDLSSEKYTPCCDIGPWTYKGDNLDGQLGKVKEVRDVYNCPPEIKGEQYEANACYIGGWEDWKCEGKVRKQQRKVINCPAGRSSYQDIDEDRDQKTTMNHCYNITGVTNVTVEGTGDFAKYRFQLMSMKRDDNTGLLGESTIVKFNQDSPAGTLDFDPKLDIRAVYAYGSTLGKDGKLELKFWDGDFMIKKLHVDVEKKMSGWHYTYNSSGDMTGGYKLPEYNRNSILYWKPMIEE